MAIARLEIERDVPEMGPATTYLDTGRKGALVATYNYTETGENGRAVDVVVACFRGEPSISQLTTVERTFKGTPIRLDIISPLMLDLLKGKA